MAFDICLIDIKGQRIEEFINTTRCHLEEFLPYDDERFPLLRCIDPYDNTVFNRAQMTSFRSEIQRLLRQTSDRDGILLLQTLDTLAATCEATRFTYLRFVGD